MRKVLILFVLSNIAIAQVCKKEFEEFLLSNKDKGQETDAVIVYKNNKLVYENYFNGYNQQMRHRAWSMTKSFNALTFAIAKDRGILSFEDKISKYIKVPDRFKDIQISHLLQMTSGIKWNEGYEAGPFNSSIVEMLFLPNGNKNMPEYVLKHEKITAPGQRYYYSSGDTLLSNAVLKAILKDNYSDFPFKELYDKLDMKSVVLEKDQSEHYVASSYMYATPRDFLKMGLFLLRQGNPLIKRDTFRWLVRSNYSVGMVYTEKNYGAGFWLNQPITALNKKSPFPSSPADTFMALGHNGQIIAVIPSQNMVMIRLGSEKKGFKFNRDKFLGFYKCLN